MTPQTPPPSGNGDPQPGSNPASATPSAGGSDPAAPFSAGGPTSSGSPAPTVPKSVDPADLLKSIMAAQQKSATLQADYAAVSQNVPNVLGVAAEILKKQKASEKALQEGIGVVQDVIQVACSKAAALSKAMQEQHDALSHLLTNEGALLKVLMDKESADLPGMSKIEELAAAASAAKSAKLALNDPKVAKLMNNLAGAVRTLLAKEIQSKISGTKAS